MLSSIGQRYIVNDIDLNPSRTMVMLLGRSSHNLQYQILLKYTSCPRYLSGELIKLEMFVYLWPPILTLKDKFRCMYSGSKDNWAHQSNTPPSTYIYSIRTCYVSLVWPLPEYSVKGKLHCQVGHCYCLGNVQERFLRLVVMMLGLQYWEVNTQ